MQTKSWPSVEGSQLSLLNFVFKSQFVNGLLIPTLLIWISIFREQWLLLRNYAFEMHIARIWLYKSFVVSACFQNYTLKNRPVAEEPGGWWPCVLSCCSLVLIRSTLYLYTLIMLFVCGLPPVVTEDILNFIWLAIFPMFKCGSFLKLLNLTQ